MVKAMLQTVIDDTPDASERLRAEIEAAITRYSRLTESYDTPVPGLRVARVIAPIAPTAYLAEASVCLCIRGSREITIGDAVFVQDEDSYLLSAIGLPSIVAIGDASSDSPYIALRIDIDLELARQVMADIDLQGMEIVQPSSCVTLGAIDPNLWDAVARLVRLIETPQDAPFMSGLVHRELLYRLLSSPSGYKLRQIVRLGSQGHRVAKAVAWLRDHFQERLSIEQLADIAGMGISTLHRHFHDLTGMSPIQYQKYLRLHDARHRMLDGQTDVGTAALSVGYESSTQFIREYRRLFGEPPFRNVRALRARGGSQQII